MTTDTHADLFDAHYYEKGCGDYPYERSADWLDSFRAIARRIVSDIAPGTVLDAGCALGMLVETLREMNIEAFGVDISEYAIQNAAPGIRAYCWQGSVTDPFPRRYDLIVTIEVLEHMTKDDAERALGNFCQHTDDILFSSSPFDYEEATHFNVQPPEYWAEQFARHGFYRDVDFDASFITRWAARFRRRDEPLHRLVRDYERRFWMLAKESADLRALALDNRNQMARDNEHIRGLEAQVEPLKAEVSRLTGQLAGANTRTAQVMGQLAARDQAVGQLTMRMAEMDAERRRLEGTAGWRVLRRLQGMRAFIAPPKSRRDRFIEQVIARRNRRGPAPAPGAAALPAVQSLQIVPPVVTRPEAAQHTAPVDVVICVHNALEDVQRCLESVVRHSTAPYQLILVDDGSSVETRDFLAHFAAGQDCRLIRNDEARGYTLAANQGLRATTGSYAVLLNSDTIVAPGWLDRLVACAESDPRIGLVGPLSNTASWQSVPELFEPGGDWAPNPLPGDLDVGRMGDLLAKYSARLYPVVPLLNGFCLLIRRAVLDEVGYFDEDTFGAGYGEEDDYTLRARASGWSLALADDAYVYHAQSRSYSNDQRQRLTQLAGAALVQKHGQEIIQQSVTAMREDAALAGIRARSRVMHERQACLAEGRARHQGRRLLFLLPVAEPGGGANVIITEAAAMREMGVEVTFFNLNCNRATFTACYPNLGFPVIFGETSWPAELGRQYDAVTATVNFSVDWLTGVEPRQGWPVRGYYVQGFEPLIYTPGTPDYQRAWRSYTLLPDLVRFTKTDWTRRQVLDNLNVESTVVGPSVDIDLFRPRPRPAPVVSGRPTRIAAMIRPNTPVRGPGATLSVLGQIARRYGTAVEIATFGAQPGDPGLVGLPTDFPWQLVGILTEHQVANFLSEADIFVDFSSHQAMGLTALEAMACGAAVIVPANGGAVSFAQHGANALVVDTSSLEACESALGQLVEDPDLRARLQSQAIADATNYYPERPALNILDALFNGRQGPAR